MLKKILIGLTLSSLVLLGITVATPLWGVSAQPASQTARSAVATAPTGTLQKMIVENGSVTMDLDLNRLNASTLRRFNDLTTLHFATGANSFFPVLVFNNQLRGPIPGSMALIPQNSVAVIGDTGVNAPSYSLPASLDRLRVASAASPLIEAGHWQPA